MDELIAAVKQMSDLSLENDKALLKVIEAIIEQVTKLQEQVTMLVEIHDLKRTLENSEEDE